MHRATNLKVGMRLALVEHGKIEALVFESARDVGLGATSACNTPALARKPAAESASAPASPFANSVGSALEDVTVRQLNLHNTLVASAVSCCCVWGVGFRGCWLACLLAGWLARLLACWLAGCPNPKAVPKPLQAHPPAPPTSIPTPPPRCPCVKHGSLRIWLPTSRTTPPPPVTCSPARPPPPLPRLSWCRCLPRMTSRWGHCTSRSRPRATLGTSRMRCWCVLCFDGKREGALGLVDWQLGGWFDQLTPLHSPRSLRIQFNPNHQGFVHCVSLTLEHKLAGQMATLKAIAAAEEQATAAASAAPSARPSLDLSPALQHPHHSDSSSINTPRSLPTPRGTLSLMTSPRPADAPYPASAPISRVGSSSRLFKVSSSKHICTDAMVRALQQEIRKRYRHSMEISDLIIVEPLGAGGFGQVGLGVVCVWGRGCF